MSITGGIMAGVGLAGSIGGAAIGANAAGNAASTQAGAAEQAAQLQYQASQNALGFQEQQYGNSQQEMMPWIQSGQGAVSQLDYELGIGPQSGYASSGMGSAFPGSAGGIGDSAYPGGNPGGTNAGGFPTARPMNGNGYTSVGAGLGSAPGAGMPGMNVPSGQAPNTGLGGYGSLMQGFQAPTALTEQNDPGYQARLALGTQALQQSAAARGSVLTGGTAKALDSYAQDYASNEYQNVYNRAYNTFESNQANEFNRLASLAGIGQTSAGQLGSLGQSASNSITGNLLGTAANIGQQYNNAAAANASGTVGAANAWSGALGNTSNSLQNLLLLQQLGQGGGSGSGGDLSGLGDLGAW